MHLLIFVILYIAFYQEFSEVQGSFVKQGFSNLQPGKPFEYVIGAYGRKEKQVIHTSGLKAFHVSHKKLEKGG